MRGVHRSSAMRWLVVRASLPAKVQRAGISTTDVALAFPLDDHASPLPPLDVCAYLPLRSFGLRFLLQADYRIE